MLGLNVGQKIGSVGEQASNQVDTSDVMAQLGWLTAQLRHLADQKWL